MDDSFGMFVRMVYDSYWWLVLLVSITVGTITARYNIENRIEDKVDEFLSFLFISGLTFVLWWFILPLVLSVGMLWFFYDMICCRGADRIIEWCREFSIRKSEESEKLRIIISKLEKELEEMKG